MAKQIKQTKKQTKNKTTKVLVKKVNKKTNAKNQKVLSVPIVMVQNETKPKKAYHNAVAVWDFRTSVNEKATYEKIIKALRTIAKRWTFQEEQGTKTEYKHYQGRFSLVKRKRKSELLKTLKEITPDFVPQYLEPTSANGSTEWFYILKEETRTKGPWKDTDQEIYVPAQYKLGHTLYPYQEQIVESTKREVNYKPDRIVNIIYDPEGCHGKTYVAGILATNRIALVVPPLRTTADIIQYVCSYCMKNNIRNLPCVFFDLPKAMSKTDLTQIFSGIEQIKNGILYDARYTGRQWEIESPTIWVFTNTKPDLILLSTDRWVVWGINNSLELYKI